MSARSFLTVLGVTISIPLLTISCKSATQETLQSEIASNETQSGPTVAMTSEAVQGIAEWKDVILVKNKDSKVADWIFVNEQLQKADGIFIPLGNSGSLYSKNSETSLKQILGMNSSFRNKMGLVFMDFNHENNDEFYDVNRAMFESCFACQGGTNQVIGMTSQKAILSSAKYGINLVPGIDNVSVSSAPDWDTLLHPEIAELAKKISIKNLSCRNS